MLDYFLVFSVILNLVLGYYFVVTFFKILPKYEEKLKFIAEEFQRGYQRLRQADLQGAFENDDYVGDAFTRIKNIYSDLSKYLTDEKYEEKQKEEK